MALLMKEIRDISTYSPGDPGISIALGRFDGVHVGHQALIKRAVGRSHELGLIPSCFSFREDTFPSHGPHGNLTTDEEKLVLSSNWGFRLFCIRHSRDRLPIPPPMHSSIRF